MLPQRWFNDYRSINNVWLPVLVSSAPCCRDARAPSFYAWPAVIAQALLRMNTPEAGAMFERIQHVLPLLTAPALAGFVRAAPGRADGLAACLPSLALYVQTVFAPIRHVPDLRAWDPPFIDRVAAADGNMILVEVSPHRDMDSHPTRRSRRRPLTCTSRGCCRASPASGFTAR